MKPVAKVLSSPQAGQYLPWAMGQLRRLRKLGPYIQQTLSPAPGVTARIIVTPEFDRIRIDAVEAGLVCPVVAGTPETVPNPLVLAFGGATENHRFAVRSRVARILATAGYPVARELASAVAHCCEHMPGGGLLVAGQTYQETASSSKRLVRLIYLLSSEAPFPLAGPSIQEAFHFVDHFGVDSYRGMSQSMPFDALSKPCLLPAVDGRYRLVYPERLLPSVDADTIAQQLVVHEFTPGNPSFTTTRFGMPVPVATSHREEVDGNRHYQCRVVWTGAQMLVWGFTWHRDAAWPDPSASVWGYVSAGPGETWFAADMSAINGQLAAWRTEWLDGDTESSSHRLDEFADWARWAWFNSMTEVLSPGRVLIITPRPFPRAAAGFVNNEPGEQVFISTNGGNSWSVGPQLGGPPLHQNTNYRREGATLREIVPFGPDCAGLVWMDRDGDGGITPATFTEYQVWWKYTLNGGVTWHDGTLAQHQLPEDHPQPWVSYRQRPTPVVPARVDPETDAVEAQLMVPVLKGGVYRIATSEDYGVTWSLAGAVTSPLAPTDRTEWQPIGSVFACNRLHTIMPPDPHARGIL